MLVAARKRGMPDPNKLWQLPTEPACKSRWPSRLRLGDKILASTKLAAKNKKGESFEAAQVRRGCES